MPARPTDIRLLAAALAAAALLVFVPAAHAQYPLQSGRLATPGATSGATLTPGQSVSVAGGGFQPGATVSIYLHSAPVLLKTVRAGAGGAIDAQVTIPAGTEPGDHTLEARGPAPGGGTLVLTQPVVVAAAAPGSDTFATAHASPATTSATKPSGTLPFTGARVWLIVLVGVAVLAAGLVLRRTTRPRHTD